MSYTPYLAFIGLCFLLACGGSYDAERQFAGACWSLADTVALPAPTRAEASLRVDLRFEADFPYRNIYLKLMAQGDDGEAHSWLLADTLLDPMGTWQTEANWDGSYPFQLRLPAGFSVPAGGDHRWQLTQYLRDSSLCGVEWVGVRWE